MKVLHLNTNDISGGAARAANRLHNALKQKGIKSYILVQRKQKNDPTIFGAKSNLYFRGVNYLRSKIDHFPKKFYPNRQKVPWSINWVSSPFLIKKIKKINPDIIHLHWINGGFVSIKDIKRISKLNKSIVWTLHDSWAFTGGCHIPHDCKEYEKSCGKCLLLGSYKEYDLSRKNWLRKKNLFSKTKMTIVTPSNWLSKCAKKSSLLKNKNIYVIPNSIDVNKFRLLDKNKLRKELGLSENKKYLLFGAMGATTDKNKGFDLLLKSLKLLKNTENLELIVFGNKNNLKIETKIPIHLFGKIDDTRKLNKLYSVSDVTIVSSRSENLPNIILESFSCGTPVVGFNVGGMPDIINHKKNGYLAKYKNTKDLAKGIEFCLFNKKLGKNAREKAVKEYNQKIQAKNYTSLYKLLQKTKINPPGE